MPTLVERAPWTDAILTMLRAATGKKIGDHEMVDVVPEGEPWAILYSLPGTTLDGPWGDPLADAELVYQVTSVGLTRKQCEMMQDLVRRTMIKPNGLGGWTIALGPPAGWAVVSRVMEEPGGGIDQAGPVGNRTVTAVDRFTVTITPS
jgi:hypothetical protein